MSVATILNMMISSNYFKHDEKYNLDLEFGGSKKVIDRMQMNSLCFYIIRSTKGHARCLSHSSNHTEPFECGINDEKMIQVGFCIKFL